MRLATACIVLLWTQAILLTASELPVGTEIQIRLQTNVASNQSKPGEPVKALVVAPVWVDGNIVILAGSMISGTIKETHTSKNGTERALLCLEFGEVSGAGMKPTKFAAKVVGVDNARETVDEAGRIVGIEASETLTAQIDKGLEKLGQRSSGLADFLQAAKGAFLKPAEVEIAYGPGAEITLQLTSRVQVAAAAAPKAASKGESAATLTFKDPGRIAGEKELDRLANGQPFQTMAEKPPQPSDLTNLMFIGSRVRLEAAFNAAGWTTAAVLNATSGLETFRAIAENRGYREAPVSTLLLDGNKPDLVFQKQNNTFAKRHHLRIWKRPGLFQGQNVWVAAATHDIGIEFSKENRTFIHKIDPQIDRERAKVVNDLLTTGQVSGLALVERPGVPHESRNATGDKLETDGNMAVLRLGGQEPVAAASPVTK